MFKKQTTESPPPAKLAGEIARAMEAEVKQLREDCIACLERGDADGARQAATQQAILESGRAKLIFASAIGESRRVAKPSPPKQETMMPPEVSFVGGSLTIAGLPARNLAPNTRLWKQFTDAFGITPSRAVETGWRP